MARFKKIKQVINKKTYELWINVDNDGKFSCQLPHEIAEALGSEDGIVYGVKADAVEHLVNKQLREYDKLVVKSEYKIKYRIMLSNRIKKQMPGAIMTDEAWDESSRIGGEYIPEESLSIIVNWFPMERRMKGKELVETKLTAPDEDDWHIVRAKEALDKGQDAEFYLNSIHKPYPGLVLVEDERHWEFDSKQVYREIPLTRETFEFFTSMESSFVSMLTKLFAFLARDEKYLMADINKAISGNFFKQLGR